MKNILQANRRETGRNGYETAVSLLEKYRVDYRKWGEGTTHPLSELVRRLEKENICLRERPEQGVLELEMNVVIVDVMYNGDLGILYLYEGEQIYHESGQVLQRQMLGIGETMCRGESPLTTARRALAEELGQTEPKFRNPANYGRIYKCQDTKRYDNRQMSRKWPGLPVVIKRKYFSLTIGERLYRRQYNEVTHVNGRPFKTTTFVWKSRAI